MSLTPEQARRLDAGLFAPEKDGDGFAGVVERRPAVAAPAIPGYTIRSVLGSGGMGTVYEAEQEHPRRLVALKVMRAGIASRRAMRWFEREIETLGHLRHPGIAQIYEAGRYDDGTGGVPWFAMEHVEGARSITRYAGDEDLSIRERLALFARVCEAVHHGHQKGVIHRDLKPENILVGVDGTSSGETTPEVKIIDFGVARATDSDLAVTTVHTEAGAIIGTLQYMSPEQSDVGPGGSIHDLDIRADMYSLGVVLYELLTDHLPYDVSHKTLGAALRVLQEADPPPPSRFRGALRGDLDAIVLKAMARDREKRYASASALADDVRRHLAGEPIEARRPTRWARAVRWVVRHPVYSTLTVCTLIFASTIILSFASVEWLTRRPAWIRVAGDRQSVQLYSMAGHPLHAWEGDVRFAEMIESSATGRRLVLIGFQGSSRGFHGFDVNGSLHRPLWTLDVSEDDLPSDSRGQSTPLDFRPETAIVADIFPHWPGQEIVVSQVASNSACVLRICDLEGRVLFQVWHDGHLRSIHWLSATATLVLTGYNTEGLWHERGVENGAGRHPHVFLAIRPEAGRIMREWISTRDFPSQFEPEWYKALVLGDRGPIVRKLDALPPNPGNPPGTAFSLNLSIRSNPDACLGLFFDERGQEIGERIPNNDYLAERDAGTVPPLVYFRFGPLPRLRPNLRRPW